MNSNVCHRYQVVEIGELNFCFNSGKCLGKGFFLVLLGVIDLVLNLIGIRAGFTMIDRLVFTGKTKDERVAISEIQKNLCSVVKR